MAATVSHLRRNDIRVTDAEGKYIPDSEIEQLRLRLDILGVCYERIDDQPGVQVLFEVTFVLPKGKTLEYARLPFQGLPSKDSSLDIWVEAVTPEGKEVECLGVYASRVTHSATPQFSAGVAPVDLSFSGVGRNEETMQQIPHNISLIGYKGAMNSKPHWEFHNELPNGKELRYQYPTHIRLVAAFASNHDQPTFPFTLRFSSDCQVTIMDRLLNAVRHAIGKPRRYQFFIPGTYRERLVKEHIRDNKCGLVAAVKRMKERVSSEEVINS